MPEGPEKLLQDFKYLRQLTRLFDGLIWFSHFRDKTALVLLALRRSFKVLIGVVKNNEILPCFFAVMRVHVRVPFTRERVKGAANIIICGAR